ncbi:MAG: hypothetical protein JKY52_13955 [Flavobacteriales bacterium]|nr:hypothetical protein [Flavobacteriales bacterium]
MTYIDENILSMEIDIEYQAKDAGYWRLVAGGWVPKQEVSKNYQHLVSSIEQHFPNMENASS